MSSQSGSVEFKFFKIWSLLYNISMGGRGYVYALEKEVEMTAATRGLSWGVTVLEIDNILKRIYPDTITCSFLLVHSVTA